MVGELREAPDGVLRDRVASDVELEFDGVPVRMVRGVARFGLVNARRPTEGVGFVEVRGFVVVGGMLNSAVPKVMKMLFTRL